MLILNLFAAGRQRETVPIFPLGTVLFPDSLLPLRIFDLAAGEAIGYGLRYRAERATRRTSTRRTPLRPPYPTT